MVTLTQQQYQGLFILVLAASFIGAFLKLLGMGASASNALGAFIASLAMLMSTRYVKPNKGSMLFLLLFLVYFFVFFVYGSHNVRGAVRLLAIFFYFLVFMSFSSRMRNEENLRVFCASTVLVATCYLTIVNLLVIPSAQNFIDPLFSRYTGLGGPNHHGVVAATGVLACLIGISGRPISPGIMMCLGYLLLNLWITGSRASFVSLIVYGVVKVFYVSKAMTLIIFGVIFIATVSVLNSPAAMLALRFNPYSIAARLDPVMWGYDAAKLNDYMPYGLSVMAERASGQHLDNTFLVILLESGWVGLLLLIFLIGWIFVIPLLSTRSEGDRAVARNVSAVLLALFAHGLFESYIFIGLNYTNIFLVALCAFIFNYEWKKRSGPGKLNTGMSG